MGLGCVFVGFGVACSSAISISPHHANQLNPKNRQGEPLPTPNTTTTDSDSESDPLARALVGPIRVDPPSSSSSSNPSSSKRSSQATTTTATLVLPLRGSAFLRLLVHGCAQYYGLKSRSEDLASEGPGTEECRAVLVTRSSAAAAASCGAVAGGANLGMTMRAFIRHSRLEQGRLKPGSKGRRLGGAGAREEGGAAAEGGEP